jgi:hypothetical protein
MNCNVNPIDGGIRAGLGLLLLASPLLDLPTFPYNYLGLVLIVTAVVGYCPVYSGVRAVVPASGPRLRRHSGSHG